MGGMVELRLQLLGEFRAMDGERPIDGFATDKVRALLAYLAAESGRAHTRTALATLLWSEWEEGAALANLRKTLFRLRQALAEAGAGAADRYLTITRGEAQFHAGISTVDLQQFEQWARSEDPTQWAAAAALYRGDLLEGLALSGAPVFEEWLTVRREQLHQQALSVLARLADHYLALGQTEQVQQYAARQLALEPWRETAHRQLMRAYAAAGQRAQALAQYTQCQAILAEELGVEPSGETKALAAGIRQDRSPAARLRHFPPAPSAFIGRDKDVDLIATRLAHPQTRLITITGTGGMGKTRLAMAAAARWVAQVNNGEAYFVPLSAVTTQQLLWQTLGQQLGVPVGKHGLSEADVLARLQSQLEDDGNNEDDSLFFYLQSPPLLLVLDNYEQLLPDTRTIERILQQAPQTRLLVTSRLPLNLRGEWRLPLVGLLVPPPHISVDEMTAYPSVQLLVSAAQQTRPSFQLDEGNAAAIGDICRLLAGMPLALEIAASWLQLYSADQLAAQIAAGVESLVATKRDIPERHRSLRVIFEHAWLLLPADARAAFSEMTCFQESFTLEAAQAITTASVPSVTVLLDHALLQRLENGCFSLHPVLRQFARAYLADDPALAQRHAAWYLSLAAAQPFGAAAAAAVSRIQADLDNIRAAWQWAVFHQAADLLAQSLSHLIEFYQFTGLYREGYEAVTLALAHVPAPLSLVNQMRLAQVVFCEKLGDVEVAIGLAQQVIDTGDGDWRVPAFIALGRLHEMRGEYEETVAVLEQALQVVQDTSTDMARIWSILGSIHRHRGDMEQSVKAHQQALQINRALDREMQVAENHASLSLVYKDTGAYTEGIAHIQEALAIAQRLNHRENIGRFTQNQGLLHWQQDELDKARDCYQRALKIAEELNHKRGMAMCTGGLGVIARRHHQFDLALEHYRRALKLAEELGDKSMQATWLGNTGNVHMEMGQYRRAVAYYQRAIDLDRAAGAMSSVARHLGNMGDTLKYQTRFAEALPLFEEAIPYLRQAGAQYYLCWVLVSYAECLFALDRYAEAQQANDEGGQLAAEVGRALYYAMSELLAARLLAVAGNLAQAQARLLQLDITVIEAVAQAELKAETSYALWEVTGDAADYQAAQAQFTHLYEQTKFARYRRRLAQMGWQRPRFL